MPDFCVVMTHTAGSCSMFKAENMKKFKELIENKEKVAEKLEVKVVSMWSPTREHQTFWIVEASSPKAEDITRCVDQLMVSEKLIHMSICNHG